MARKHEENTSRVSHGINVILFYVPVHAMHASDGRQRFHVISVPTNVFKHRFYFYTVFAGAYFTSQGISKNPVKLYPFSSSVRTVLIGFNIKLLAGTWPLYNNYAGSP